MKRILLAVGFAVLFVSSCSVIDTDNSLPNSFNSSLRGTWETFPESPSFNTTVVIDYGMIRITGIRRPSPLDSFTPNSALQGYSEETHNSWDEKRGLIYIKDKGSWQDPIQYIYWLDANQEKRLTLKINPDLTFFPKSP